MKTGPECPPVSRRSFVAAIAATPLVAGMALRNVTAQEATPAPMGVEETQQVLGAYAMALLGGGDFGQFLAEDTVVRFMDVGQQTSGRQAVVDGLIELHTIQFDAQPEVVNVAVGEGIAAVEALFVGSHTGEFGGIPPTGTSVNAPYVTFRTMENGLIVENRLYGLVSGLMQQLSGVDVSEPSTPAG